MQASPKKYSIRKHQGRNRNPQVIFDENMREEEGVLRPFFNVSFTDYCGLSLRKKLHVQFAEHKNSGILARKLSSKGKGKQRASSRDWLKVVPAKVGKNDWRVIENRLKTEHDRTVPRNSGVKVTEWITNKLAQIHTLGISRRMQASGRQVSLQQKKNKKQFRPSTAEVHQDSPDHQCRLRRLKTQGECRSKEPQLLQRSFGLRGWEQV